MKIFQKGFNYSQDGPGNRLVYHLQGCNMRCPWCANPEGLDPKGVLVRDEEWILASICPHEAIRGTDIDRSVCKGCAGMECIRCHTTKGLRFSCTSVTPETLLEEAKDNSPMFYDGGGVTFTGGEATLQFEELKKALTLLKQNKINTCIETNGTHPRLSELFPLLDAIIMDCKLIDPDRHKQWTGINGEIVLENIRKAAASHPHLHVRVPMIGGVNTSREDLDAFTAFFSEINSEHVTFEALLYHEYGKKKYADCGYTYTMTDSAFVEPEIRTEFIKKIRAAGCRYVLT